MCKKGFSLIEVMITAGLSGIVFLALSSMVLNSQKAQRNAMISSEIQNLQSLLQITLLDPNTCASNFGSSNPNGGLTFSGAGSGPWTATFPNNKSILAVNNPTTNQPVLQAVQTAPNSGDYYVKSIDMTVSQSGSQFIGSLTFTAYKLGSFMGAPVITSKPISLALATSGSGPIQITNCSISAAILASSNSLSSPNPNPNPSSTPTQLYSCPVAGSCGTCVGQVSISQTCQPGVIKGSAGILNTGKVSGSAGCSFYSFGTTPIPVKTCTPIGNPI